MAAVTGSDHAAHRSFGLVKRHIEAKIDPRRVLGKGKFGIVVSLIDSPSSVVKFTSHYSAATETMLLNIDFPALLKVTQLSHARDEPAISAVVMEKLVPHTTMFSKGVPTDLALRHTIQIYTAITFLQSLGLTHVDIYLNNIMYRNADTAVLSDVGSLAPISHRPSYGMPMCSTLMVGPITTWPCRAPEHWHFSPSTYIITHASALYSLAVVACAWLQGGRWPSMTLQYGKDFGGTSEPPHEFVVNVCHTPQLWLSPAKAHELKKLGHDIFVNMLFRWLSPIPTERTHLEAQLGAAGKDITCFMGVSLVTPHVAIQKHALADLARSAMSKTLATAIQIDELCATTRFKRTRKEFGDQIALRIIEIAVRLQLLYLRYQQTAPFLACANFAHEICINVSDWVDTSLPMSPLPRIIPQLLPFKYEIAFRNFTFEDGVQHLNCILYGGHA